MSKWGDCSYDELLEIKKKLEQFEKEERAKFMSDCARELAQRLLAKVIKRTPVGKTVNSRVGGTLRRGWTGGTNSGAAYAKSLKVDKQGNSYVIEIINPVEYASYVEYGHRQTPGRFVPAIGKRLKAGWVEGRHMLSISVDEIEKIQPKLLEKRLQEQLEKILE